jgi:hypothetical protein
MAVYKHTFIVTVLTDGDPGYNPYALEVLAYDISDGEHIGDFSKQSVDIVPSDKVADELIAIGNDGTFFDYEDDDAG